MTRPRKSSAASEESSNTAREQVGGDKRHITCRSLSRRVLTPSQELGSMYDYLAKIILLGPSGSGK